MKIKFITTSDLVNLYLFNNHVFIERIDSKSIIDFWYNKGSKEYNSSIILTGENEEIWGQILSSSMLYFYQNSIRQGNWIFDYIVQEDKRKDGYGIDLLQFALQNKKVPIFATGSGPLALKIELKMGFKLIGELKKYVGISNPIFLPVSVFRGIIPKKKYPVSVKTKAATFQLTYAGLLPDYSNTFNPELLEFGRDNAFLNWRYFSDLHEYTFYKQVRGDDYFVVRTIVKKGITCLVLVDYRCDFSNKQNFSTLLNAVKKVASKLKLAVIVSGSSLKIADEMFEKKGFKSIGRPRPIISTEKFKEEQQRITNREFVFTTLADSDGEINW